MLLTGLSILVAEDEYFQAEQIKTTLLEAGAFLVRLSGELSDSLVAVQKDGYSFVLIDINLQGERAFPIADKLLMAGVPFGFITGFDQTALPSRFARAPYWRKPIDPPKLLRGLHRICFGSDP